MRNLPPPSMTPSPAGIARTYMNSSSLMALESAHLTRNGRTRTCSTKPGRTFRVSRPLSNSSMCSTLVTTGHTCAPSSSPALIRVTLSA